MGSEGEIVDFNPTIYVAVGRNVKEGKSLLKWAAQSFEERKICLLHVHQPTILFSLLNGNLSESKFKNQAIKACQELERLKMQKLMNQYLLFTSQMGIQADKILIQMSNAEKGIVKLIVQHKISHLVMGAAADTIYLTEKSTEVKSSKAMIVCQQAPLSCHIWFASKGCLIYSRPVGSGSHLSTTLTLSSSANGGGPTLTHYPVENRDGDGDNVQFLEHPKSTEEVIGQLDATSSTVESRGGSPLYAKVKSPEYISHSSSKGFLDYKFHKKETGDLCDKLEHAVIDAESWNQRAFEESLRRWRAEEDAFDAVRKAEAAESQWKEEMIRRQEIEELLSTQNLELQTMKNQHDQSLKELQLIWDQKPALENQLKKAHGIEKELEDKIIQAVNLLITFKGTRDGLQIEYDSAIRKVNKLKTLAKGDPKGISSPHFFGISFSDIIDATQNFNPSLKLGEGSNGSVFKGILCHVKVAIKMLLSSGSQSDSEFKHEAEILSRVRHPNLVTLIGACPESRSLIYEYCENGSLEDFLSGHGKTRTLSWQIRIRIAVEICSALVFLHVNHNCIVHGNLKPSNVLLDPNFVSKVSEFGIYNLISQDEGPFTCPASCSNNEPETSAYLDPEFLENGVLTTQSDVYSFGIVLLRLLTVRPARCIVRDVKCALERGQLNSVLDISAGDWPLEHAKQLANLALRCCEKNHLDRPDLLSEIWVVLEPLRDLCSSLLPLTSNSSCLNSKSQHKIPSHFVCPIFQEVMKDPHIAADGFTYEEDAIKGWFNSGHKTSPMTNLKLENCDLLPNYALYYAIQEWQQHT